MSDLFLAGLMLKLTGKNDEDKVMAYETLKRLTDEDFGYDNMAWQEWFYNNDYEIAYKGLLKHKKAKDVDK